MIRSMWLGEFAGTLMMLLLGNGVVAAVVLKQTKAEAAGWMVITTGWAFAVLCGNFTASLFGSADAHLNPAITVAFAVKNGDFSNLLSFASAQIAGAFAGSILVWLIYFPHWELTDDKQAKLGAFCTGPAVYRPGFNLLSEIIGTFVLVTVAGAISSKLVLTTGAAAGLSPFLIACLVWAIGLSLGATTGYAINPARDFGPRLAHQLLPIAGKGDSNWGYCWIPILGPVLGASMAGALLRFIGA